MRFFSHVSLLAAVLPFALAQYDAPPDNACSSGAYRCDNNTLQVCGNGTDWKTLKKCSKTAYCFAQYTAHGGGDCYPLIRGGDMQCSTVNDHRCNINSLEECGDHGYWSTVKNCTQTAYCFAQDTIDGGGDCHPLVLDNDKQCSTVDIHRCSTNTLEVCGDHGYWKTAKNCTQTAYCFAQDTVDGGGDCHPLVAGLNEQCSVANDHRCQNNTLQVCTDHGYWNTIKNCNQSETCSLNSKYIDGGLCLPTNSTSDPSRCKANAHRCHNNTIQDCTLREHWSTRETCDGNQICIDNCHPGGCEPYCLTMSHYNTPPSTNDTASYHANKRFDPELCDRPGTERCSYDPARVQSCSNNIWVDKELCPKDTICWADKNFDTGDETATCVENPFPPKPASKRTDLDYCNQRFFDRCAYNPARIQHCSSEHMWTNKEFCTNGTTCLAYKNPETDNSGVACAARPIISDNMSRTCTPGDLTCDANLYTLQECNANGTWDIIKKCATPGDCKIDGPGQAHCQSGGMNPPKSKRAGSCHPGDLACDKDRRFLFTCGADGKWEGDPLQCFGAGYCRPEGSFALTCAGFPLYDGDNGKCDSHCETMDYLYCIGGSWESPAVVRKCLRGMCQMEDCRACDRCNFKMPYGVALQPDLSTLVPAKD